MRLLELASRDVHLVAGGFAVDGLTPLERPLSFPRDEAVLYAVGVLGLTLYSFIHVEHPEVLEKPELRTALIFKLMAYLSRTGRVRPQAIRDSVQDVAMAATMLADQPHLITEPVNFAALVARYQRFLAAARRQPPKRPEAPDDTPPRPLVWTSADGRYLLTELAHPWHLINETNALGHCVGRTKDNHRIGSARDLFNLPYWKLITSRRARIFSFGEPRQPLCTLHVDMRPLSLVEAQGRAQQLLIDQPFYPALVEAIAHLQTRLDGLTISEALPMQLLNRRSPLPACQRALTQQLGRALRREVALP